nr:unnamed protein product [Digitaria exilis]
MEYSTPTNMPAARPRMRGAVVAPPQTTMEGGESGLQRLRGTVTLSLKPPEEPEVLPPPSMGVSVKASSPETEEEGEEKPATTPAMRGAVQHPRATKAAAAAAGSVGCQAIADMAGRLGVAPGVADQAMGVFRRLEQAKGKWHHYYTKGPGRSGDALYAACIYVACRSAGAPRTFKELAAATRDGAAARKDIGKLIGLIKTKLGDDAAAAGGEAMNIGVVRPVDFMERFGSLLGMGEDEVRAVQEAARRMNDKLDVRRNPDSTAAAIIYMAIERRGDRRSSIRDVSAATGVADNTIKQAYKELYPHAQLLFDQSAC